MKKIITQKVIKNLYKAILKNNKYMKKASMTYDGYVYTDDGNTYNDEIGIEFYLKSDLTHEEIFEGVMDQYEEII